MTWQIFNFAQICTSYGSSILQLLNFAIKIRYSINYLHYYENYSTATIPGTVRGVDGSDCRRNHHVWGFYYCQNLKLLIIPGSVETIGSNFISGCPSLSDISINTTYLPIGSGNTVHWTWPDNATVRVPVGAVEHNIQLRQQYQGRGGRLRLCLERQRQLLLPHECPLLHFRQFPWRDRRGVGLWRWNACANYANYMAAGHIVPLMQEGRDHAGRGPLGFGERFF